MTERPHKLARVQPQIDDERKAADEKVALLNQAEEKLGSAFEALSSDAAREDLELEAIETIERTVRGLPGRISLQ
jgi:hypothetical protein